MGYLFKKEEEKHFFDFNPILYTLVKYFCII